MSALSRSQSRRVKHVISYDDVIWTLVQFVADGEYSDVLKGELVVLETSGMTVQDAWPNNVKPGDQCIAPWNKGRCFKAVIVFTSEDRETTLKELSKARAPTSGKKAIGQRCHNREGQREDQREGQENGEAIRHSPGTAGIF